MGSSRGWSSGHLIIGAPLASGALHDGCERGENDKRNAQGCQTRPTFDSEAASYKFAIFFHSHCGGVISVDSTIFLIHKTLFQRFSRMEWPHGWTG
jgi:hypothetical protein